MGFGNHASAENTAGKQLLISGERRRFMFSFRNVDFFSIAGFLQLISDDRASVGRLARARKYFVSIGVLNI